MNLVEFEGCLLNHEMVWWVKCTAGGWNGTNHNKSLLEVNVGGQLMTWSYSDMVLAREAYASLKAILKEWRAA